MSKIVRVAGSLESKLLRGGKWSRKASIKRLIDWKAAAKAWNSLVGRSTQLGQYITCAEELKRGAYWGSTGL